VVGEGKLVIQWTYNGAVLTPEICQSLRIDSMSTLFLHRTDPSQGAEYINVTCGLDRFSAQHLPEGPVRIIVDAVRATGTQGTCRPYSGSAQAVTTTSYNQTPITILLKQTTDCP
jgi:hypothetical protein